VLQKTAQKFWNIHTTIIYTFRILSYLKVGRDRSVAQQLATGWTVRGSNPGGGEIIRTCPDRPWDPPNLLYNGYRVFSGGKAPGAWHWPPTPSSAEVKERVACSRVNITSYLKRKNTGLWEHHTVFICPHLKCWYKWPIFTKLGTIQYHWRPLVCL
jgi:hypothetical protein